MNMGDIKYKQLLTFALPYLSVCGGLWQYSYWSTFDTNILLNLNSVDIIKSFIFPFAASAGFYFLGHFLSLFIFAPFVKKLEPSQPPSKKVRLIMRLIFEISLLSIFIVSLISKANEKWVFSSVILSIVTYMFIIDKGFLMKVIPDRNIQKKIVFTVVLVPFLCFGFAKT